MKSAAKLKFRINISITPTSPFDFDSTFHKPDHFTSGDNEWKSGTRWQAFNWKGKSLGLIFSNKGTVEKPQIDVGIYSSLQLGGEYTDSLIKEIKYRFNLDMNLKGFYEKFSDDKIIAPVITKWRGMRPGQPSSLYEYLIIGIVLQNATVRRSVSMFKALLEKYGESVEFDGKKLWCFWGEGELKNVSVEKLRSLKVGYRAKYIKKIDDAFINDNFDEYKLRNMDLEIQQSELLKLYGVGPATVWYLLFDVFHHWDFFNHISPWEQKIYSKLFFNADPEKPVPVKKLLKHFEKYKPYQQLVVHYIWEDLWWKRKNENIPWLEKLIRL